MINLQQTKSYHKQLGKNKINPDYSAPQTPKHRGKGFFEAQANPLPPDKDDVHFREIAALVPES